MIYVQSAAEAEAIEWLNSRDGLLWSRKHHRQSRWAKRMFSLKDDLDADLEADSDRQLWTSWGFVNFQGEYRPGRRPAPDWEEGTDTPPVAEAPPVVVTEPVTASLSDIWDEASRAAADQAAQRAIEEASFVPDPSVRVGDLSEFTGEFTCSIEACNEMIERFQAVFRSTGESLGRAVYAIGTPMSPDQQRLYDSLVGQSAIFQSPPQDIQWFDYNVAVEGLTEASGEFTGTFDSEPWWGRSLHAVIYDEARRMSGEEGNTDER